jgi:hypothetical protein
LRWRHDGSVVRVHILYREEEVSLGENAIDDAGEVAVLL